MPAGPSAFLYDDGVRRARLSQPSTRVHSTWRPAAVIPVRGLEAAKTRLGEALDPEERASLVRDLLAATVAALRRLEIPTWVVSPDPAVLQVAAEGGAAPLRQEEGDLNGALRLGREAAQQAGATVLLVVPADLPAVTGGALEEVLSAARQAAATGERLVLLVPDRRGDGTNLLVLSPPDVVEFAFGPGSRARHRAAAAAAGARYLEVEGPLGLDLDTADDLVQAEPFLLAALHDH
jgi:2-phospho-L-lactate guanylyltransferase